jgi:mannan endo-1,6-alpha-mannosidase
LTCSQTISNAAFFQIAARLARYTGDSTYVDWADKTWDWMTGVGLISLPNYFVFDGTDSKINCSQIDHTGWSYNPAMLLYGTATLYNITNGAQIWADRTTGLLGYIEKYFFSPYDNATNM